MGEFGHQTTTTKILVDRGGIDKDACSPPNLLYIYICVVCSVLHPNLSKPLDRGMCPMYMCEVASIFVDPSKGGLGNEEIRNMQ